MNIRKIRAEIDRVDSEIIDLLSKRQTLVRQAGRPKSSIRSVRCTDCLDEVIGKVKRKEVRCGLDPSATDNIYRNIIEYFMDYETGTLSDMRIEYQDV